MSFELLNEEKPEDKRNYRSNELAKNSKRISQKIQVEN